MTIQTVDDVTLGAWFILSDVHYQKLRGSSLQPLASPSSDVIKVALETYSTILYLHGVSGSRATNWRIQQYFGFSSRLQVNTLVIDYRGFGDSAGIPSEQGLASDAHAAWSWLIDRGAKAEDIFIVGHSLGTVVSGKLVPLPVKEGVKPRGVVLFSPFSGVTTLTESYSLWEVPILRPLQSFSLGRSR
ncbi:hypothetical protein AcW2_007673 [Taiwanofungus camphoratus]|nr:hypothetical protein AcW2_007673 [Antrodia cinnamomea]